MFTSKDALIQATIDLEVAVDDYNQCAYFWIGGSVVQTAQRRVNDAVREFFGAAQDAGIEYSAAMRESYEFNRTWAAHKNEFARIEREQEAAAFMAGL